VWHHGVCKAAVAKPAYRFLVLMLTWLLVPREFVGDAVAANNNKTARSYWLLVTFAAGGTPDEMTVLKDSAFDGIAIQIGTAYDTGAPPSADSITARLTRLKDAAQREPFLDDWRAALRVARRLGVPGVVLDLEFYSNPSIAYAMSRFARQAGVSAPEAARRLEGLGHELGDIAASEYPDARIWVLTTGLTKPADERIGDKAFFQPRGHIVLGLLEELSRLSSPAVVIDGGEDGLGYCHATVPDLHANIRTRQQKEQTVLSTFRSTLILAGPIAPWSDSASKKGWLSEGACGSAQADRAEDFAAYLQLLDATYEFNWIYAAPLGGYQPFNPAVAARFDAVLRGARGQPAARANSQ
jgi:hypothetical protein